MQLISETGQQELVWTKPSAPTPTYELYAGEQLVATLHWQRGSLAEARAAGCQWTFERSGFWLPRVVVRLAGSDADLATFTPQWIGTGTLEGARERRFHWSAENFWHTRWAWQDADGTPLLHIEGKPRSEHGGRPIKGIVKLAPAASDLIELPLLVLLGWYLVVLHTEDVVAATAARSTTAATYVAVNH
jgi:hypothetical protein